MHAQLTTTPIATEAEASKLSYREAMTLGDRIPEGVSGPWRIERKDVEVGLSFSARSTPAGRYTGLIHERRGLMMSDTPDEMRDHSQFFYECHRRGGRIIIGGLGIGMVLQSVLRLPNVEHVDVIEIDEDVIKLTSPAFAGDIQAGRLTIHHADIFEKTWKPGTRWNVAWWDIWIDICVDNLPEMTKIHRKYGRRVDWQDSWCKGLTEYHRDRNKRNRWY
jgi:Spermine/spermidine synthase domain